MQLTESELGLAIQVLEADEKAFVLTKYRDIASTAHANVLFRMGLQSPEVMKAGYDMYNASMAGLQTDLLDIYAKFSAQTYDIAQAMARFKEVLGARYEELFRSGAMASGNMYYDKVGLTRKELSFISAARRKEMEYFRRFLIDMRNPKHVPVHPYDERIKYYGQSGRSQFFNGLIAGFGTDVEIRWVIDYASESCPDCINLSRRVWTWDTLPTTPRSGSTACLMRCRCHLNMTHKGSLKQFVIGGRASSAALVAPGRYAFVYDSAGNEIGGELQRLVEDLSARMNKARQMIEISYGADKLRWIATRSSLNQQLIDLQKSRGVVTVPAVSVADLESTIKSIAGKGGTLIEDFSIFVVGDEVLFVRSDFSAVGVLFLENNRMSFKSGSNVIVTLNPETDIIFSLGSQVRNQSVATMSLATAETTSAVAAVETYKLAIQNNESILPVIVDKSNPSRIVSGAERAQAYSELGYNEIPVIRVNYQQFLDDLIEYGEEQALLNQGWNADV